MFRVLTLCVPVAALALALIASPVRWPGFWGPRGILKSSPSKESRHAQEFESSARQAPSSVHG